MPIHSANLAALRDGRFYKRRDEQPVKFKLDADGSGVSIELPGPRIMAEKFVLPWLRERFDVYRSGAALLVRPKGADAEPAPLNQLALAADLRAALAALPDLPTAGRPYEDSRKAAEGGTAKMDAYLATVVVVVRRIASVWKAPAAVVDAAPALTVAERKAAQRERERATEEASAREWLEGYLDSPDEPPTPGDRVNAAELYDSAVEVIGDYVEDGETRDDGGTYRVPRRRVFFAVADELFGASRKRGAHGSALVYTILDPATRQETTMNLADAVIERVIEKLADEMVDKFGDGVRSEIVARLRSGDRSGALNLQRAHLAATGTDGAVFDLAAHRARR